MDVVPARDSMAPEGDPQGPPALLSDDDPLPAGEVPNDRPLPSVSSLGAPGNGTEPRDRMDDAGGRSLPGGSRRYPRVRFRDVDWKHQSKELSARDRRFALGFGASLAGLTLAAIGFLEIVSPRGSLVLGLGLFALGWLVIAVFALASYRRGASRTPGIAPSLAGKASEVLWKCPGCGTLCEVSLGACPKCGRALTPSEVTLASLAAGVAPGGRSATVRSASSITLRFVRENGRLLAMCPRCAAKFDPTLPACPRCGHAMPPGTARLLQVAQERAQAIRAGREDDRPLPP